MTVTRFATISDPGKNMAVMDEIAVIGAGPYGLSGASHLVMGLGMGEMFASMVLGY